MFLGLVDATFNLQQGVYQHDPLALALNLICIIGGGFLIGWYLRYFLE
jgi:hypothetical protein